MTQDTNKYLTKYNIVMTKSETDVINSQPLTKEEAEEKIGKLNTFCPPYKINYEIKPIKLRLPNKGLPNVGDRMYVPGGLDHAMLSSLDNLYIKRINGGLATISALEHIADFWAVDFEELTYPAFHVGCAGISEDSVSYNLEFLQKNQERYKRLYGNRNATIECDRKGAHGKLAMDEFHESFGGDWK